MKNQERQEGEMVTLVVYDVSDNKVRTKICESCKDHGLTRVQWSVFRGKIGKSMRQRLLDHLQGLVTDVPGSNVQMYVMNDKDFEQHLMISE